MIKQTQKQEIESSRWRSVEHLHCSNYSQWHNAKSAQHLELLTRAHVRPRITSSFNFNSNHGTKLINGRPSNEISPTVQSCQRHGRFRLIRQSKREGGQHEEVDSTLPTCDARGGWVQEGTHDFSLRSSAARGGIWSRQPDPDLTRARRGRELTRTLEARNICVRNTTSITHFRVYTSHIPNPLAIAHRYSIQLLKCN